MERPFEKEFEPKRRFGLEFPEWLGTRIPT